jgi:hypothetical protein
MRGIRSLKNHLLGTEDMIFGGSMPLWFQGRGGSSNVATAVVDSFAEAA